VDFSLSEEQCALQSAAREFAQKRLVGPAQSIETSGEPPSRALIADYATHGFLGVNVPAALGGLGQGNLEALIVLEEFGKISSAVAFPVFESCVGPVRAIERFGNDDLKSRVVPRVCRGEIVVAIAMSEPGAGSALTDLTTRAETRGERVVLNGAVYVEKDAAGLSFGKQEHLMGFRGVPSADLYFDNCSVPLVNIIVPAGGFKRLMEAFDLERCGNATMALAQASGALEDVIRYVQERKQFGKPIVEFQAVQLRLAEMQMKVDAARLLIWRAACNAQSGLPSVMDSSVAKCYANEIAREVTGHAVQLMGAYGYSREYPMERRLRDAWGWGIAGGAVDIQKVNIAAAMIGRRFAQRD